MDNVVVENVFFALRTFQQFIAIPSNFTNTHRKHIKELHVDLYNSIGNGLDREIDLLSSACVFDALLKYRTYITGGVVKVELYWS